MKYTLIALATAAVFFFSSGATMADAPIPEYTVITDDKPFEIRDYKPYVIAEITVSGARRDAANAAFQPLFDYISGGDIPMTAPVTQTRAEIPMTAPVTQQQGDTPNSWRVAFIMPAERTMTDLPKPQNPDVRLIEVPAKRYAVIRFSGWAFDDTIDEKTALLNDYIGSQKLSPVTATPMLGFYDPPWTLPFFRRNEVMFEIKPTDKP